MIVRVGALAVSVCLLAGCTAAGDGGQDYNPAHQPDYGSGRTSSRDDSALPDRDSREHHDDHVVRGGAISAGNPATFALVNGADVVRVRVGDLGGDLFEVSTPEDSKVLPRVAVDQSTVVAGLRDTGLGGPALVNVVLSDDVRWGVRLAGGAGDQTVDLTGGPGGDVDFAAGTNRAEVSLPAASGTQRVVLGGGASQFVVHVAGASPVRVAARGGAGSVSIEGENRSGIAGGSVFVAPGWESAADRFDIDATSGVSTLTVTRS